MTKKVTNINKLKVKKVREKVNEITNDMNNTNNRIKDSRLAFRRKIYGATYDKMASDIAHKEGFVSLYHDSVNKVAVKSHSRSFFVRMKGMTLLHEEISIEDANREIELLEEDGKIITCYDITHTFYI